MLKTCRILPILLLLTLALTSAPPAAQAGPLGFKLEGAAEAWRMTPRGDLEGSANLGLDGDLGFGDEAALGFWVRLEHAVPFLPDLRFRFDKADFSGKGSVKKPFSFGGERFRLGFPYSAEFDLALADLTGYYHFPLLSTATLEVFDLQYGLTLRYVESKLKLHDRLTPQDASEDMSGIIPLFYLGARVSPLDFLSILGELHLMNWGDRSGLDTSLELQFHPFTEYLILGLGYRYTKVEASDMGDLDLDANFSGMYGEIGFSF